MAQAFLHFGGAGGTGADFNIEACVSADALPQNAAENTMAVISPTAVTGYRISRDMPEEASEGMVWIRTGEESETAFEAAEALEVRPLYVKQFVDGCWVNRETWIRQQDVWHCLSVWCLYDRGDGSEDVTGGWTVGEGSGDAMLEEERIVLMTTSSSKARIHVVTQNPVNLTDFRTLRARVTLTHNDDNSRMNLCRLGYGETANVSLASTATKVEAEVYGTGQREFSYDISDVTGSMYVIFGIGYYSLTAQVDRVWLER